MKRFILYFRVSTGKQERSGLGLEAQRADVARYLSAHGTAIREFVETESGKSHKNRPALLAALDACRKHKATLLIARLDRLARNVAFIASLMESGVEFVIVDMPHASKFTIHILAAVAEHERELISKRTKDALAAAKARGVKLGGPNPLAALAKANAAKQLRPPAKHVLDLMTELRDAVTSYELIANELNSRDIRTPQGCRWYGATVRAALLRAYARNHEIACTSHLQGPEFEAIPSVFDLNAGRRSKTEGAFMPSDIREAERMLDLFTSVGARNFVVTKTELEWPGHKKVKWGKTYSAAELSRLLPAMVRTAAERKPIAASDGKIVYAGENLIVRPVGPDVVFVQLDDLSAEQLERVRPAAFLIHTTSPGNHQAWIAVEGVAKAESKDFIRRVRKAMGDADKSASGASRIAGVENWKEKYLPEPPIVSIVYAMPGRVMTPEQLQAMGLLAEPEPVNEHSHAPARVSRSTSGRTWPDYGRCVAGAPQNKDGSGPDRSMADWTFCLFAARRGFTADEIEAQLLQVSPRAQERARCHDEGYARITARNAVGAVERERQVGRSVSS